MLENLDFWVRQGGIWVGQCPMSDCYFNPYTITIESSALRHAKVLHKSTDMWNPPVVVSTPENLNKVKIKNEYATPLNS